MLLGPHALVGAAIASSFVNPLIGLPLAFLSHFVLDRIPHWEYSIEPLKNIKTLGVKHCFPILARIALDIGAGYALIISAVVLSSVEIPFWAWAFGGLFGMLPDSLSFLLYAMRGRGGAFYSFLKLFYVFHQKIHYSKEGGLPPLRIGLGSQAIAVLLALYFIIF